MSGLLQKIKTWYAKIRIKRESYVVSGIKPIRDWRILLISTLVIVVVMAIFAFYFYVQIDKGKLFVVKVSKTQNDTKINEVLLKKTVNDINSRKASLNEIRNKNAPEDPSI